MGGFPRTSISMGFSFSDDPEIPSKAPTAIARSKYHTTASYDVEEESGQSTLSSTRHRNTPSRTDLAPHDITINGLRNNMRLHPDENTGPGFATSRGSDDDEADEEDNDDDNDSTPLDEDDKRIRQDGNAFEKQRKITHELDTIDKIIVNLKRQNFPNSQIAEELRKLGLSNYDPKTVGSRFIRVEKKIEDHEAQRIEDGLTDWLDGEDDMLLHADKLAQAEIQDVIMRAKARRWQLVAKYLQKFLKKETKYGPKACEKRFTDLMNDCASIPIELDDDPEARRAERAIRVMQKLAERAEAASREANAKEKKKQATQDAELHKLMNRTAKVKKQAADLEVKAEKAKTKLLEQNQKQQNLEQQRRAEKAKLERAAKKYAKNNGLAYTAQPSVAPSATPATPVAASSTIPMASSTSMVSKRKRSATAMDITESPRNRMSCKELGNLLGLRNLIKGGTKEQQIERLEADDQRTAMKDLQEKCRGQGMSTEGTREQLIERIVAKEVGQSNWARKHISELGVSRSVTPNNAFAESDEQEDSASITDEPMAKRVNFGGSVSNGTDDEGIGAERAKTVDSGVGHDTEV